MLKNWCFWTVVLEKTLESPLDSKEIQPVSPKGSQSWVYIGRTDAEVEAAILWPPDCEESIHWKRPRCWKRLKAEGEEGSRGWHGWRASLTQWTWVWAKSRRYWLTRKPGLLQSMGSQRVRHNLATEQLQQRHIFTRTSTWKSIYFSKNNTKGPNWKPCSVGKDTSSSWVLYFNLCLSSSVWPLKSLPSFSAVTFE